MRRPLVAGNWKMNGTRSSVAALVDGIKAGIDGVTAEVVVCPAYVFLDQVRAALAGGPIGLGAQDVCDRDEGAFTGEVSGPMLAESGCNWVIVGHSERRQYYAESDALVAAKFAAARRAGLTPILCVGETLEEREAGRTEQVVERQLAAVAEHNGAAAFAEGVIAYEPVWAIGTGKTASPEQAQAVHAFVRDWLRARAGAAVAEAVRILYGGSVKGANAAELFAQPDIDGGLIGGASLKAEEFLTICRAAA
ncbi:MAG: triosephosphate isomerase [Gammaproteobacteria bacterium]|nr:MAG: triosephosphate isomerase [Gammaproteobacteria bacterium]